MSKFEPKTFAQSMAEVAAHLPVDEEAEREILRLMRSQEIAHATAEIERMNEDVAETEKMIAELTEHLELPDPTREESLSKHPCSERCWRIGYQPVDVPPGEPCPECGQPWPTKARRTPPTAVRPALEQLLAAELDAMERILASGGDHADALIGGLRVMLRDLEGAM